jgi:SAM-dependent methyltransferase
MSEIGKAAVTAAVSGAGAAEATATAATLRDLLPPDLLSLISVSFIRSHLLYEEFVDRLVVRVARETGLEAATREPASAQEVVARLGLEARHALVPLDWVLRRLTARGMLEDTGAVGADRRFRSRGAWPAPDPVPVREEQRRHDPACLPSYALAETVAQDYPAFLRGETAGEEVLFSPRRFRLWIDYFSNANGLYAVSNHVGAVAVAAWSRRVGGVILELGGGLGSGALAVLDRLEAAGRLGEIGEYRFTELVPAFLRRGQASLQVRYENPAWLRFGALDMNRPFAEQGVRPGTLAVVYAVNALHVAHDLDFTLGEVLHALEPAGQLIVSECVRPHTRQTIYAEFIFNLMETFRAPRLHPVRRPAGGFLTAEQWRSAIEAAGFADVRFLPDILRVRERVPDFYAAAIGATRPA